MPALHHLQPRADLDIGISATAIGLIVGFGIIPVIIIIWVVIFLFFAYPYDRNWCCMKRKKHKDNIPDVPDQVSSQESFSNEKMHYGGAPNRPYAVQVRTDSGESSYSNNNARLMKERPSASHARYDTRMSLQSVGSAQGVSQEPKPFV